MDSLKKVIVEHLGYPFPELFVIRRKGKNVPDNDTVATLHIKPNDSSLEVICTNLDSLYSELRRAGKL